MLKQSVWNVPNLELRCFSCVPLANASSCPRCWRQAAEQNSERASTDSSPQAPVIQSGQCEVCAVCSHSGSATLKAHHRLGQWVEPDSEPGLKWPIGARSSSCVQSLFGGALSASVLRRNSVDLKDGHYTKSSRNANLGNGWEWTRSEIICLSCLCVWRRWRTLALKVRMSTHIYSTFLHFWVLRRALPHIAEWGVFVVDLSLIVARESSSCFFLLSVLHVLTPMLLTHSVMWRTHWQKGAVLLHFGQIMNAKLTYPQSPLKSEHISDNQNPCLITVQTYFMILCSFFILALKFSIFRKTEGNSSWQTGW